MRKRYCDVCEGEIDRLEGRFIDDTALGTISVEAIGRDICQSCIIEAIGEMYIKTLKDLPAWLRHPGIDSAQSVFKNQSKS